MPFLIARTQEEDPKFLKIKTNKTLQSPNQSFEVQESRLNHQEGNSIEDNYNKFVKLRVQKDKKNIKKEHTNLLNDFAK